MDSQPVWRAREPRSGVVPEQVNQEAYGAVPRHPDDRGRIHRVADGVAAGLHRRPGLRHEVGHGLDARHPAVLRRKDPIHRKYHHNKLTFRGLYAFTENFMLPLSHDEVVHGKGSLIGKMAGDDWQKFANLRLLFGYMFTQPGKKLLFMGGEIAQWTRVEPRQQRAMGLAALGAASGSAALGQRLERLLSQRACTLSAGFQS